MILMLVLAALLAQTPAATARSPLAPGGKVYVQAVDRKGVRAEIVTALRDWDRWTVVDTAADAALFATVKLTGSGSKGTMRITISETPDGPTLWQGYDEGRKNPYRKGDAFTRCLAVIMDQMREASAQWPTR